MDQEAAYSSASCDAYGRGIYGYDEDCAFSNQSDFYSAVGVSSSPMMSSGSISSMDAIDLVLDANSMSTQTSTPDGIHITTVGGSGGGHVDANEIISQPDNASDINIYTYPSGRPPLVPLDWEKKSNYRKPQSKPKVESKQGDREVAMGGEMSWISRTLCIGNTPFDTVDHTDGDNNTTWLSKDGCASLIDKRGSGSFRYCSREDDDDVYFNSRSSYQEDDRAKEVDQSYHPIAAEGGSTCNKDENTLQTLSQEEVSDTIQLNLEMFASLNDYFKEGSMLCNDWSTWYNVMEQKSEIIATKPSFYQNRVIPRNSTSNLAARKRRIEYLRRNLTPFESDWTELNQGAINVKKYSPVECGDVKFSFSNAFVSSSAYEKERVDKSPAKSLKPNDCVNDCSPLIDTSCGNINDTKDIDNDLTEEDDEEELSSDDDEEDKHFCYDSDPSDLMHLDKYNKIRRTSKSNRLRRRVRIDVDAIDETTCLQKIAEHMNAKRLLVWHRGSTEGAADPPVAVQSWLEHGSQLDSGLIQPKFCWRRSYGKEPHSKSILKFSRYHGIDLLDISRIVAADNYIERNYYPFVKRKNSFVIEAFEQELVFEARDEAERDDIVEGLKLLVARLGSKIIMGDGRVLDEFFSPMGASVPGKMPSVFTMES